LPARETSHAALGNRSTPAGRLALGAAALTAWDLFLDPQMVGEGYWRWLRRGAYRGIPLGNFVGWFVTSLGVMTVLEVVLPPDDPGADLVAAYGGMAVMETVGFAAYFRDRVVAAAGGAAMLPFAAFGLAGLLGRRHPA
jgi:putative membrane protein